MRKKQVEAPVAQESPELAYAKRVWAGQSPDLPRNERIQRVVKALEGQGLPTEINYDDLQ